MLQDLIHKCLAKINENLLPENLYIYTSTLSFTVASAYKNQMLKKGK